MAFINEFTLRLFGGKSAGAPNDWNVANQETGETVPVSTVRRMFKGPQTHCQWSYHGRCTIAGGAGSQLKFYYSNLPNPDPTNMSHWVDSGIAAQVLTATTPFRGDIMDKFPLYIMAEVVVATSAADLYLWVRAQGVQV